MDRAYTHQGCGSGTAFKKGQIRIRTWKKGRIRISKISKEGRIRINPTRIHMPAPNVALYIFLSLLYHYQRLWQRPLLKNFIEALWTHIYMNKHFLVFLTFHVLWFFWRSKNKQNYQVWTCNQQSALFSRVGSGSNLFLSIIIFIKKIALLTMNVMVLY